MERILALDYGDKTIGVAVSDELGLTAQGVTVIRRSSRDADMVALRGLVDRFGIERIVVGLPRNMDGSIGPKARLAQRFGESLTAALGLPVEFEDERLTTAAAERALLEADVSRAGRRRVVDRLAASLILQGYLERERRRNRPDRGDDRGGVKTRPGG